MDSKPNLQLFIGMFVGVVVREKDVGPPAKITMLYGLLYEVVWLWRYSDGKWLPGMKNFPTPTKFFYMTLLKFTLVSKNAIKIFCPLGPNTENFWVGGGGRRAS